MARYTNYDDLLKKWHDLGLDEISKIHKVNAFNHFIKTLPTADVVEVKHGTWIWAENGEEDYEQYWICSVCGEKEYFKTNYCSDCGAKMDGGKTE